MPRAAIPLRHAYRLLNHGPTVLVSSAHAGRRNVMAAAWNMPLDFDPPKVAVVIDKSTFTRELIEASGEFVLAVPGRAVAAQVLAVGSRSGRDGVPVKKQGREKFPPVLINSLSRPYFPGSRRKLGITWSTPLPIVWIVK